MKDKWYLLKKWAWGGEHLITCLSFFSNFLFKLSIIILIFYVVIKRSLINHLLLPSPISPTFVCIYFLNCTATCHIYVVLLEGHWPQPPTPTHLPPPHLSTGFGFIDRPFLFKKINNYFYMSLELEKYSLRK